MKVTVSVSEALVPKLAIGDEADVSVSAAGAAFTAVIRSVERTANLQTKLYTVTLAVPAEVSGLLSGMFADVTFHTDVSENAVVVPSEAILTSADTQYVFVVEGDAARYVGKAEEHLMRSKALVRLVQPLVNALGKVVENHLDDLDKDNQKDHRHPHHRGDAPLMAIADGNVAQTAGAHSAGNGGVG